MITKKQNIKTRILTLFLIMAGTMVTTNAASNGDTQPSKALDDIIVSGIDDEAGKGVLTWMYSDWLRPDRSFGGYKNYILGSPKANTAANFICVLGGLYASWRVLSWLYSRYVGPKPKTDLIDSRKDKNVLFATAEGVGILIDKVLYGRKELTPEEIVKYKAYFAWEAKKDKVKAVAKWGSYAALFASLVFKLAKASRTN